jgi:hypothetical protein
MNTSLLAGSAALLLAASALPAQQVAITEHFAAGVPPAGWSQVKNNPLTNGWIASAAGEAWHEDESSSVGTCDDELISPVLDLSTYGTVYAHFKTRLAFSNYLANHPSSLGDGENDLYVRINGGAWTEVWTDVRTLNTTDVISVDITAAVAGQSNVEFAFRYYGTFAQEWWVDYVQVSDSAAPPVFGTFFSLNLPGSFIAADGSCDDLESYGGVVPGHMATTSRNSTTLAADPEGWCTIAGGTYASSSGVRNLEMGLIPGTTNYHNVTNALVMGFDGAGTSNLQLDFNAIDHGEETQALDGVWLSKDGAEWFQVYGPWTPLPLAWTAIHVDLSAHAARTSGNFYLAFVQEDNFPYANLDGIGVDDVCVGDPPPPPFSMTASGTCPGVRLFEVTGATPNGWVFWLYGPAGSYTKPGGTCAGLTIDIRGPGATGGRLRADANGYTSLQLSAASYKCGTWKAQVVDLSTCAATNSVFF